MKITKIYIENFAKLNKQEFLFDEKLTTILHENGWGKSTLATFIKTMFYGLSGSRKTAINENERKKFKPWQGGKFGGYLEFDVNGKQYRVTRFFDKTGSDEFGLTDLKTNKPSLDYSENLGNELFGLDVLGFERTVFINNENLNLDNAETDSLSQKIASLFEDGSNDESSQKAIKLLDDKRKELYATNKSGLIPRLQEQLLELKREIEVLQNDKLILSNKKERAKNIEKEIEEINNKLQLLSKDLELTRRQKEQQIVKQTLAEKQTKLQELQNNLNNTVNTFGGKQLSESEVENIEKLSLQINKYDVLILNNVNDADECVAKLDKYIPLFDNKSNVEREIDDNINNIRALKLIKDEEQVENQLNSKPDKTLQSSIKKQTKLYGIFLMIVLSLLVGGILSFRHFKILSYVLFAVSGLMLLFGGLALLVNKLISQKLGSITNVSNARNYNGLVSNAESNETVIKKTNEKVKEFLLQFYLDNEFSELEPALINLRNNYNQYENLKSSIKKLNQDLVELQNNKKDAVEQFGTLTKNFVLKQTQPLKVVEEIKQNFNNAKKLNSEILSLKSDIKNYENEHTELINRKNETTTTYEENLETEKMLTQTKEELSFELTRVRVDINSLQNKTDNLVLKVSEKQELESELNELQEELNLVKQTIELIKTAQENITSMYLQPIKNSFMEIGQNLNLNQFGKIVLNSSLQLSIQNGAENYSWEYYSKGYKDIFDLLLRLSLTDVLFSNVKPFIVLDDPFINLDNENSEILYEVVKSLSQKYQIIYLTCHSSRKI